MFRRIEEGTTTYRDVFLVIGTIILALLVGLLVGIYL